MGPLKRSWKAWLPGATVGLFVLLRGIEQAVTAPLQHFDEGIQLNAVAFLAHGLVPLAQFYQPYGPALGLPGLPAHLLFPGHDLLAQRISYALVPALAVTLAYIWAARRVAWPVALGVALIASLQPVIRYELPWLVLLAFLLAVEHVIRRTSSQTLRAAVAERRTALVLASSVIGLAAWFRPEYTAFAVAWAVVVAAYSQSRRAWLPAAASIAVALTPFAVIAAVGPGHLARWFDYSAFRFRRYRGLPIEWNLPLKWASAPFHGHYNTMAAIVLASYLVAVAVVLVGVANLLLPRQRKILRPDHTGVVAFLIVVCAIVTYAQSVRFSGGNGGAMLLLVWTTAATLPFRSHVVRPLAVGVAVAILVGQIAPLVKAPFVLRHDWRQGGFGEQVPRLDHVVLTPGERPSIAATYALWHQRMKGVGKVFVLNLRNDDAQGNPAFLYWFLNQKPAAWPTTFDPGLADTVAMQHEVTRDLCRNRAPLLQHTLSYSVFASPDHRSRYLDQFVALSYNVDWTAGLFRALVPRPGPCRLPESTPTSAVVARRSQLIAQDDMARAGALSTLLIERSVAAGGRPSEYDASSAVLGGYWEPDSYLPQNAAGAAIRSLRDQRPDPGIRLGAVDSARVDDMSALAAINGVINFGRDENPPGLTAAAQRLAFRRPGWPAALEAASAVVPGTSKLLDALARTGARGIALERWRLSVAASAGDVAGAETAVRKLLPLLKDDPLSRGDALEQLAALYDRIGNAACALEARAHADLLPGVDPGRYGPGEYTPQPCPSLPA